MSKLYGASDEEKMAVYNGCGAKNGIGTPNAKWELESQIKAAATIEDIETIQW